ncbi:peptidyl-prolyl cis-trans isomerase [bacterium]|nr:peptidyl-prolyl cis-trans isomerase [bacterium]MBU4560776.1 peptidyl-prolyl cis-trans isomerase [bacterium]MCG2676055.1 peptidyl-prolyl cis-trans isomerase [bacterium]
MLVFVSYSQAEIVERVVARLNDEIITLTELEKAYRELKSALPEGEKMPSERNLLERMIENRLLLQEAKREGIRVSQGEVHENIERMKSTFLSEKAFEMALEQEGMKIEDLKKRYEEELMIKKLIDREVKPEIEVSKKEIREYYEKNKKRFKEEEKVKIRHIFFKDYFQAEKALKRIKSGTNFEEVAKGGYLGSFKRGQLDRKIEEVAFNLKEGEISSIVKTESGCHIIKLEKKEEARVKELSEAKEVIRNILSSQRMEQKIEEYLEELKAKQEIEISL